MILSDQERRRIRSQVACSLSNLGTFRVYWSPRHRRILCRSVQVTRRFRVPEGAVLVGRYSHGIATQDILDDLAELLAQLPEPAVLTAPADECELHQADHETAAPAAPGNAGDEIEHAEVLPHAPASGNAPRPRKRRHPWRD